MTGRDSPSDACRATASVAVPIDVANPGVRPPLERALECLPIAEPLAELWGSEHVWCFGV